MKRLLLSLALAAITSLAAAGGLPDAIGTADAFDRAIAQGDTAAALALLAPDVLIYESGGQEASRDDYAAHHLPADIAFMAQMRRQVLDRRHGESGDLAWVATRRRLTGTYKGKPLDLLSTETLLLQRQAGAWRIAHIQWSSQPAGPKTP
jgi:ketosteroid isomerase-like protein